MLKPLSLMALGLGGAWTAAIATADPFKLPVLACAAHPGQPSSLQVVLGFPGQPAYVYSSHPRVCGATAGKNCTRAASVVSGTRLSAGADCDGWTYVAVQDHDRTATGWLASRRLTTDLTAVDFVSRLAAPASSAPAGASVAAHPVPVASSPSVCKAALVILNNNGLFRKAFANLLTAPDAIITPDVEGSLPEGSLPDNVREALGGVDGPIRIFSASIQGQPVKVVPYREGGEHLWNDIVTVWSGDFQRLLTDTLHSEELDFTQELVSYRGTTLLTEESHSSGNLTLYGFDGHLTEHSLCTLAVIKTEDAERVESATDPAVCKAATGGEVEDAGLDDVATYGLRFAAIKRSAETSERVPEDTVEIVSVGTVDLDNDGTPERVGLAVWEPSQTAAMPEPIHMEWPIKLAKDGTPAPHAPLNLAAYGHAGDNDATRVFRFHGVTYVEHRWRPDNSQHSHEIWKFTPSGQERVCKFTTDQSQHYEIENANR
jgi:hypothetical protein